MPDIASNAVFPSIKFISTDADGDVQETVGVDASSASGSLQDIDFDAVASGAGGNQISVEISDNSGSADAVSVTGNAIEVALQNAISSGTPAVKSSVSFDGITIEAATGGVAGDNILIEINDMQIGDAVSVSGNTVTLDFVNDWDNALLTSEIASAINNDANASALVTAVDSNPPNTVATDGSAGTPYSQILSGGVDSVAANYATSDVVTLLQGDASATALIAITGGSSAVPATATAQLSAGADAVAPQLDPSTEYVLISRSDIHGFETAEINDGRKLIWGVLESAFQHVDGLTDSAKPENLTFSRGNASTLSGGLILRQTYTVQAKYPASGFDLASE